jgi:hypothetical protein
VTDRARRFWGVSEGKVGWLSGWHALVAGAVLAGLAVWARNGWTFAAMAILVLRAMVALWLTRAARRTREHATGDRADDAARRAQLDAAARQAGAGPTRP